MDDFTTITGALLLGDCNLEEAIAVAKQRQRRRQRILQRNATQPNHALPTPADYYDSPPNVQRSGLGATTEPCDR